MTNITEIKKIFVNLYEIHGDKKKYIGYCYDYVLQIDEKTFKNFNENPCNISYKNNKYIMHLKKQINEDIYEVSLSQVGYTKYLK